ncbi:NADP-dependent oxidoreductase [Paraburkholderia sp.]|uniref:NADP-dependent oxidoreductase n=1 Tax=Paraburkholderia sp. TaxID=1926495 RepID=UPI00239F4767|nr:NADP-dependent oxidoreductase [Paraburkholderia sp.]MDE1179075.1 NADP-dependent oxidoreductase [Paraburkholderia sp.]
MADPIINRRIVLAKYLEGEPSDSHFRIEQTPMRELGDGEVLLKSVFLSLDPYVRNRMTNAQSYAKGLSIGDVVIGETVAEVVASRHSAFGPGDRVLSWVGWQEYAISDGSDLRLLPYADVPPSTFLGVLGMPGMTAYTGLAEIGKPQAGETVVVPAASGPVGSAVGQIARIQGARAVGIAGGATKCKRLIDDYGFDAAVDHRAPDFEAQLRHACPNGIDVYFDSVGGHPLTVATSMLNDFSRIPLCGTIADYTLPASPPGPDRRPSFVRALLTHRVTMRGFIVYDFAHRKAEFEEAMSAWIRAGTIRYREDISVGLESAPGTFIGMLGGKNDGKVIVAL